ncbi:uracil-DNA glycosylase [Hydrocarboniclastica marina]|uniref:Uracil-DNA glycosylase n=1 Tax=Hydrocarboniclastica marina TaxID=2259620 RepID=A0A4P7XFC6_9ALTE|nr:uracil-DNA glycosylase [Hydrocarboniclastica marina]MAL99743.1 uracil-DNA glycosylase [Alteromonadaceae bacterium]QCF25283.1 uracil-DNA glycosylase [Hydrocarboniclastica marina]|tara:strand:- start:1568 stop:2368 length:801 start_codon:yes stop_codon:yes gene_type:complete
MARHPIEVLKDALAVGSGWRERLEAEFQQDYLMRLSEFLASEELAGKSIFPPRQLCFNALNATPFDHVGVVILGQDPYHGAGQAHGLCFSVRPGVKIPPSLRNMFKELKSELGIDPPDHGCLQPWANQGVLLLNSVLTVEEGSAGSHQGRGWERFTDRVIGALNAEREGVVFMLWGSYAQKKGQFIDRRRHLVLESPHPSPLSASRGFLGNGHFAKANGWLDANGKPEIDWQLPDKATLLTEYGISESEITGLGPANAAAGRACYP